MSGESEQSVIFTLGFEPDSNAEALLQSMSNFGVQLQDGLIGNAKEAVGGAVSVVKKSQSDVVKVFEGTAKDIENRASKIKPQKIKVDVEVDDSKVRGAVDNLLSESEKAAGMQVSGGSILEGLIASAEELGVALSGVDELLDSPSTALKKWADEGGANIDRLIAKRDELAKAIESGLPIDGPEAEAAQEKFLSDRRALEEELTKLSRGRQAVAQKMRAQEIKEQRELLQKERELADEQARIANEARASKREPTPNIPQSVVDEAFAKADAKRAAALEKEKEQFRTKSGRIDAIEQQAAMELKARKRLAEKQARELREQAQAIEAEAAKSLSVDPSKISELDQSSEEVKAYKRSIQEAINFREEADEIEIKAAQDKEDKKTAIAQKGAAQRAKISGPSNPPNEPNDPLGDIKNRLKKAKGSTESLQDIVQVAGAVADLTEEYKESAVTAVEYGQVAEAAFGQAVTASTQAVAGAGQLARAYALLNFSGSAVLGQNKETAESYELLTQKTMQLVAGSQALIDAVTGFRNVTSSSIQAINKFAEYMSAREVASRAAARAEKIQNVLSQKRSANLRKEAAALRAATKAENANTAAKGRNARARRRGGGGLTLASARNLGRGGGTGDLLTEALESMPTSRRAKLFGVKAQRSITGGLGRVINPVTSRIGAGGLASAGSGAIASVGALAAAATAAAAGIGLAGKSIYDTVARIRSGADHFEVNSFADKVGQVTANIGDTIADAADAVSGALFGTAEGFIDIIDDEATARMQEAERKRAKAEALSQQIERIELDRAKMISSIQQRHGDRQFADSLRGVGTPQEREALVKQEYDKRKSELDSLESQLNDPKLTEGQARDDVERQRAEAAERFRDITNQRIQAEQASLAEKRRAQAEEIQNAQQLLQIKQREVETIQAGIESSAKSFASMSRGDQRRAVRALEKARGGGELRLRDIKLLDGLGTEESNELAKKQYDRLARERGFGTVIQGEEEKLKKARQEEDAAFARTNNALKDAEQDQIEGTAEQLRAQLKIDPTITLVDQREFQLKSDEMAAQIAEGLLANLEGFEQRVVDAAVEKVNAQQDRLRQEQADANPVLDPSRNSR